jgi:hypothetical protein
MTQKESLLTMPKNESLSKLHSAGGGQDARTGDYEPTPLMSIKHDEGGDQLLGVTSPAELMVLAEQEEDKPFYGTERLDIVERALEKRAQKDERDKISPVTLAAARAQEPHKTLSVQELGTTYDGPSKYLNQRDAPLEIPFEVVDKLFKAMDQDLDDKVSLDELLNYVKQHEIAIPTETVLEMFNHAASFRRVTQEDQYQRPLTIQEIQYAVRGRHAWDSAKKEWVISYKPFRNEWIILLLTVQERLFALQIPKVVPSKIKAQYEVQAEQDTYV